MYQQKTMNYNNQYKLPAFDFMSKSIMMQNTTMYQYKANIYYAEQDAISV